MKAQITVRQVDQEIFKEFKAQAVEQGLTVGAALTLAMLQFKEEKKQRKKFTSLKPISWGKGTESVSQSVDEILYQ